MDRQKDEIAIASTALAYNASIAARCKNTVVGNRKASHMIVICDGAISVEGRVIQ